MSGTLPRYVSREPDRHGNVRYYFRRYGKRTRLLGEPGSPEFAESLGDARNGTITRNPGAVRQYVYFITYGKIRVKIGTSKDVRRRLAQLRIGAPGGCKIVYTTPGDSRLEAKLHQKFAEDRVSGEWFQFSTAIREWIESDKARRAEERGVLAVLRTPKEQILSHPHLSHPTPSGKTNEISNT